ncbi:MAG: uridine kinase [Thermosediminibacterales bacterium]|nr:uridine kinase [Thermosediminibacterales bacterium]MDK2836428.1 uridine kinase [Thermosediminibacterales bacterium]
MELNISIDGTVKKYMKGKSLLEISKDFQEKHPYLIVAALVDNELRELTYCPENDCSVTFIDLSDEYGNKIYVRSLSFVFIRAAKELFPNCRVTVEHSLGKGLYCEIHGKKHLNEKDVSAIESRMREIVENDEPFVKETVSLKKAIDLFKKQGQMDKVRLLKYRKDPFINIYSCGWLKDYFYGYMVPSTGFLKKFKLKFYLPGLIILYPHKENPDIVPEFKDQPKLARIFRESEHWAEILKVGDVGSLNDYIASGRSGELIQIAEALHEKKLAQIADMITQNIERLHLILIAGPSSSGKTTFAQRLAIQLKVNGLQPVSISLDDYFLNREQTPLDEDGKPDFEAIEAIDLDLFNEHLIKLIHGEMVEIPRFNFKTGKREPKGIPLKIKKNQPIIIEGIHGLNERLTPSIPKDNKFKIYVSALTQLNIDDHNRIPTTDTRIIRRIVRDSQFRSLDALGTIKLWPSVRRGEEKNIFPFQEDADVMFNSALVYELAVLKKYAEPLLKEIDSSSPEYPKAKILLKFLQYFLPIGDEKDIPPNSILREFIGGSCFR